MKSKQALSKRILSLALVLSGCAATDDSETNATAVEEIPVTTTSEVARELFEQGRSASEIGRERQANRLFESAVEHDPSFALAYLQIAYTAASALEFTDNAKRARQHLEGKSEGERLMIEISQTFFTNDVARRLELAQQLTERYPRTPRAWLTLAGVQGDQNQPEAARESIHQALALDPENLPAHFGLWRSYLFQEPKDFARAEQAMLESLEIAPGEAKVYENLGDVYRAMNDLDKARESYSRAIEADPTLSAANIKKGHINSFLGNFDQARKDYDEGVEGGEGPERITYANYRAFTHLHAGDPDAALAELEALVAASDQAQIPDDQRAGAKIFTLNNQATIALHHDRFEAAEKILAELAELLRATSKRVDDPDFSRQQEANILFWQSQLLARRGDYQAARETAEAHRALLANDNNPRRFEGYQGLLGLIELRRGNYRQAADHLAKSTLEKMYVKYHLALAEEGAGNVEEAKTLFRVVAQWNFNSVGFALVRRDAMKRMG